MTHRIWDWMRRALAPAADKRKNGDARLAGTNDVPGLMRSADLAFDHGNFSAAATNYRRVSALAPDNTIAHTKLGFALKELGQLDDADSVLNRALELDPARAEIHYFLGEIAKTRGNAEEASRHWHNAINLMPDFEPPYLELCYQSLLQGMPVDAMQWISRGIEHCPPSASLLYCRSNLQVNEGACATAIDGYRQALVLQPNRADINANLGLAFLLQKQPAIAAEYLSAAVAIDPRLTNAWYILGNTNIELARLDEAVKCFERVLSIESSHADANFCLGNALLGLERLDDAIKAYEAAAMLTPDRVEVLGNLGCALLRQGNAPAALECLERAQSLAPSSVEAHYNLATALQSLGRNDKAIPAYESALALDPKHTESLFNLGTLFELDENLNDAITCYEQLLANAPEHTAAHCNLGRCFQAQYRLDEAFSSYRRAIDTDPAFAVGLVNISDVLINQNKFGDAVAMCDRALEIEPDNADAHFNKSLALLAMGDYRAGWREYEYRWYCSIAGGKPEFLQTEWNGQQSLEGKTILLYGEQGLGDTLQFIRYADLLARQGATIHVLVPQTLAPLLAQMAHVDAVFTPAQSLAPFDYHCALMSLPLLCGTELSSIPANVPYLSSGKEKLRQWRSRVSDANPGGNLRVGLVWAGNPRKNYRGDMIDRMRSLHLAQLAPLLEVGGVTFYSLQLGDDAVAQLSGYPHIVDLTAQLHDFEDTAAFAGNLDLIISVDTSVVHLAGAIGKPVWVLNRYNSCWRWLADRDDSPWYPSLRLFRQHVAGDWASVITNVSQALVELVSAAQRGRGK